MPGWIVTFEVVIPNGEAEDDGEALVYAAQEVHDGNAVPTVEPAP